jgi:quercetin dioxygenase-like cupin family protein
MACHISVLSAGHRPHPPHIHQEEELLVMLDGEAEIELADDPNSTGSSRHKIRPGMFSYYPATQHHTIHNVSARPATYLMFKWQGGVVDNDAPLSARVFEYDAAVSTSEPKPMAQKLLFQQGTHALAKLHCHLTTLQPGAGYAAHADPYDVAILLLSGEVETIGARVRPFGLMYYSAGQLHDMKNIAATPASYLVFEFHGAANDVPARRTTTERLKRGIGRRVRKALKFVERFRA